MKYKNIILTDKGLLAMNAPIKDQFDSDDWNQQALQQAIKEGVYFHSGQTMNVAIACAGNGILEKNQVYPVPDGYEVRVEEEPTTPMDQTSYPSFNKYAILVPKRKTGFEENIKGVDKLLSTIEKRLEEVKHQPCDTKCGRSECVFSCAYPSVPRQVEKCSCLTDDGFADIICRRCHKPKKCEYCGGDGVYIDADSNRLDCPVCTKDAGDDYPVTKEMKDKMKEDLIKIAKTPLFKQQSIEEAAKEYAENGLSFKSSIKGLIEDGFIAGVKSQAAKEYWFKELVQLIDEEFLVNTQNYPKEYHKMYASKINRVKEQFKQKP